MRTDEATLKYEIPHKGKDNPPRSKQQCVVLVLMLLSGLLTKLNPVFHVVLFTIWLWQSCPNHFTPVTLKEDEGGDPKGGGGITYPLDSSTPLYHWLSSDQQVLHRASILPSWHKGGRSPQVWMPTFPVLL